MPAFGFEYEHAKLEGVSFEWLAQPVAIHTDPAAGRIECIADGMRLPRQFRARIFICCATW